MDGVKVALGNRRTTVEAARKVRKSGEPWCTCDLMSLTRPFLLGAVFFLTALSCSGGYHLERGGLQYMMRLGQTLKRALLSKIKGQVSSVCL